MKVESNIKVTIRENVTPCKTVLIKKRTLKVDLWDYFQTLIKNGYLANDTKLSARVDRFLIYKHLNYLITIELLDIELEVIKEID